ncbi:DUF998 domain-containing protein [Ornithinimicrobium sp. F0845]|uniref:DUF998 domain-containing protein n=1 Tax=Ornithinimicrobium sp. F0845 TaxID=2926412 RepID=UPI001FF21E74|nr:DUF998 domain-containing protein [Ornithinimicrobium sp. F0845]MCK0112967.1 DUF998 domain-containing protein [Ornithinimicrobium sp. F0845]
MPALLWCGLVGTAGFVLTFLIDGATRPGYRPTYHAVSALATGDRGWVQGTNFLVCGALIAAGGIGVGDATGSLLLGAAVVVWGLALIASGVFPMDPVRGYPPGTPAGDPAETSRSHVRHDQAGIVVFLALPVSAAIAAFVLDGTWQWLSAAAAVLTLGLLALFVRAWDRDAPGTGLVQRAMIITGWVWLGALCWHLLT